MPELNLTFHLFIFLIGFVTNAVIAWRKNSELALTMALIFEMCAILEGFNLI